MLPPVEPEGYLAIGKNPKAKFSLNLYRGEGMALLAMNWLGSEPPPEDFVGFAIEYQEPDGDKFYALDNRLSFLSNDGNINPNIQSSRLSPFQLFRWVHFPFHADLKGLYTYRVTPVFMDEQGKLSYGDFQEAAIALKSETWPGQLNVTFTRGFVSSQAFVDRFQGNGAPLLPPSVKQGLSFKATNPNEEIALAWMGFEAREAIMGVLQNAINAADDTIEVRATAYDLNEPVIVEKFKALGKKLKIIIDDSNDHGDNDSAETYAAGRLADAGATVQRQHVGVLQHNKTIAVKGKNGAVVCGSTNLSWRGFFVQNNNAIILQGDQVVDIFFQAWQDLYNHKNSAGGFAGTASSKGWIPLGLTGVNASVAFSPHSGQYELLKSLADDIAASQSSLLYSLAFLFESKGVILYAIEGVVKKESVFVYGLSDKSVSGLDVQLPDGNPPIAFPSNLLDHLPEPFKQETTGGRGPRMHHKFVVIDFDNPDKARVYMGSYNFSEAADTTNGENLLCIRDQKVAVAYMIEALSMFDHYAFRDAQAKAASARKKLCLATPPQGPTDLPWWSADYTNAERIRDRLLFSKDITK